MFEILNTSGTIVELFPNSGPGPKSLSSGDTINGYFGVVQASELNLNGILIDKYLKEGFSSDYIHADAATATWHKFFIDEKVVYVPTSPFIKQRTYQQYSDAGFRSFSEHLEYTDWRKDFLGGKPQSQLIVTGEGSKKAVFGIRLGVPAALTENTYDVSDSFNNEYARTVARLYGEVGGIRYSTRYSTNSTMNLVRTPLAWLGGTSLTLASSIPMASYTTGKIYSVNHTTLSSYSYIPVLELVTDANMTFSVQIDNVVSGDISYAETVAVQPSAYDGPQPAHPTLSHERGAEEPVALSSTPHRFFEAADKPVLSKGASSEAIEITSEIAGFEVTIEEGAKVGSGMLIYVSDVISDIQEVSSAAALVNLKPNGAVANVVVENPNTFTFLN